MARQQMPPLPAPFDADAAARARRQRGRTIWLGIGMANLAGMALILINNALASVKDIYIASDFTLVPLVMGIVGEFYWRTLRPSHGLRLGLMAATSGIALVLAAVFLREGAICLLMVSPLLLVVVWLGALLGSWLFAKADSRLRVSVLPLMLLLMVGDARTPHRYEGAISDTVTIHAPPAQVWRYVAGYPQITRPPDYWLWRIGLPCPVQSTASGDYVGAERRCIFTRGDTFQERISVCRPARELTFVITNQPRDPEILNHLDLEQGRFLLRDDGDGTTTLIGTSWYRLNVYPAAYFDLWTRDIIRHVHRRVMAQIKSLAETSQRLAGSSLAARSSARSAISSLPSALRPFHVPSLARTHPQVVSRQVLPSISSRSPVASSAASKAGSWNLARTTRSITANRRAPHPSRKVTRLPRRLAA